MKTPGVDYTIDASQSFCDMSIVVNRQQYERPSKITVKKIAEVYENCENVPLSNVRIVATACFSL